MPRPRDRHLTDDEFIHVALGDLPPDAREAVNAHLERCPECAGSLNEYHEADESFPAQAFAAHRDTLVARLRERLGLGSAVEPFVVALLPSLAFAGLGTQEEERDSEDTGEPPRPSTGNWRTQASPDERLTVEVNHAGDSYFYVTFATSDPALDGATVRFGLFEVGTPDDSTSGDTLFEVNLSKRMDQQRWEADWEGRAVDRELRILDVRRR